MQPSAAQAHTAHLAGILSNVPTKQFNIVSYEMPLATRRRRHHIGLRAVPTPSRRSLRIAKPRNPGRKESNQVAKKKDIVQVVVIWTIVAVLSAISYIGYRMYTDVPPRRSIQAGSVSREEYYFCTHKADNPDLKKTCDESMQRYPDQWQQAEAAWLGK